MMMSDNTAITIDDYINISYEPAQFLFIILQAFDFGYACPLNLADTFSCNCMIFPDFIKRLFHSAIQAITAADHLLLTSGETRQQALCTIRMIHCRAAISLRRTSFFHNLATLT